MTTAPKSHEAGPTILLVEDDEMLRRGLSRTLTDQHFTVLEAENGDAALEIVRGLSSPPALVLTDILMPVMDGVEFARLFRSLYPSIPILFMSGSIPHRAPGISLRDVGAHLLLKPFGPDILLEAVTTMLTRERRRIRRTPA